MIEMIVYIIYKVALKISTKFLALHIRSGI